MNYILFDDNSRKQLLPFTYTRPIAGIRIGILTITEKWEKALNTKVSFYTEDYLQKLFPCNVADEMVFINGKICPNSELIKQILELDNSCGLKKGNDLIAYKTNRVEEFHISLISSNSVKEITCDYLSINNVWDIFSKNAQAIQNDFELLTSGKNHSGCLLQIN